MKTGTALKKLSHRLREIWYIDTAVSVLNPLNLVLHLISLLYRATVSLRNLMYNSGIFKQHKLPCTVISIGNITVGGTGKTPTVIMLAKMLKEKGYKLGLVTGTNSSRVRKILTAGLLELFDSIVTGDDVKKGKPHPEPYLNAAKMLGVAPGKCVVIENAPYGIESAKRADMFCVAITTSLPIEYLKRADKIIDKLEQLSSII